VFGSVAFGGALARGRTGLKRATILGIGAGGAWPLVVLGGVQWLSIAAIIDAARWIARVRSRQSSGKAWRTTLVPFGPAKHSGADLTGVGETPSADTTLLISGSTLASWRTSAKNATTHSRQQPELPVHTCGAMAPVELPGWGITFGPILVARLRRPTPRHIHSAPEFLAPASRP
jgi:hypothetical protein